MAEMQPSATPEVIPNPFIGGEPSTHPDVVAAQANTPTVVSPTGVAPAQMPAPPTALTSTPAPAPTGVAAPGPGVVSDPFATPPMTDPTGQSAMPEVSTGVDVMNPPIEFPLIHAGMVATGSALGGAAGIPAGGGVADLATVPIGMFLGGAAGDAIYMPMQNLVDVLRGTKNAQGEPITPSQEAMSMLTNGLMSIGGIGGQRLGTALGEAGARALAQKGIFGASLKEAGGILGGGVGVATGEMTANAWAATAKMWGLIPNQYRTPELLQGIKDAAMNGGLDMLINIAMHTPMAAKLVARKAAFVINGITPEMVTNSAIAQSFGIDLPLSTLTKRTATLKFFQTIASVVPLVNKPYHDLYNRNVESIDGYAKDLPNKVAPGQEITTASLGQTSKDAANAAFTPLADAYNDRRAELLAQAKSGGVLFSVDSKNGIDANGNPVGSLKDWAGGILGLVKARNTPQYDMSPGAKPGSLVPYEHGTSNVTTENQGLMDLANKIQLTPNKGRTVDQLEAWGEEADLIYKKAVENGDPTDPKIRRLAAQIDSFKESLNGAFTDSYSANPNAPSWRAIGEDMLKNDKEMADNRKLFSDPLTYKILQGKVNTDALGEAIFKTTSPQQMASLKNTVGDANVAKAAAVALKHAMSDAGASGLVDARFRPDDLAKAFDLDNPSSNRFQAMKIAMDASPIKMDDLLAFVKAARTAENGAPPNFNTMVGRKLSFGSIGAVLKGVLPVGAAISGSSVFGPGVGVGGDPWSYFDWVERLTDYGQSCLSP